MCCSLEKGTLISNMVGEYDHTTQMSSQQVVNCEEGA